MYTVGEIDNGDPALNAKFQGALDATLNYPMYWTLRHVRLNCVCVCVCVCLCLCLCVCLCRCLSVYVCRYLCECVCLQLSNSVLTPLLNTSLHSPAHICICLCLCVPSHLLPSSSSSQVFQEKQSAWTIHNDLQNQRAAFTDISVLGLFLDNHDNPRFLNVRNDQCALANGIAFIMFAEVRQLCSHALFFFCFFFFQIH